MTVLTWLRNSYIPYHVSVYRLPSSRVPEIVLSFPLPAQDVHTHPTIQFSHPYKKTSVSLLLSFSMY